MSGVKVMEQWKGSGPVHLLVETIYGQAWCGARTQFRHRVRPGTREEVTCPTCLKRMRIGRPQARGARR